tara:strand:- start:1643 stop:1966 length:324 start_codon:yes stop_codon:yes gene_type:complete
MIKKKLNILTIIIITIFLYSCQSAKDAFQSKKRSDQSDEFLVQKKNPLVMPPDFEKLPTPGNQEFYKEEITDSSDIKDLLKIKENNNQENNSDQPTGIEITILKKIQ